MAAEPTKNNISFSSICSFLPKNSKKKKRKKER